MDSETKQYDFIIIGSGMGGLCSGVLLGMEGHSVLILEKNHQVGGSLQVFSRDKCVFDTGVHYIGSLDEGENLHKIFKYMGILDELPLHRLDDKNFDTFRFPNGRTFQIGQGYDNFINGLCEAFPDEKGAIDIFCEKIKEVCTYFPLYNLEVDSPDNYINNPELLELDAWQFVSSITDNEELKSVLLGNGALYAGEMHITPFYVVALITNSFIKGSYRIKNGGGELSKALSRKFHSLGGEILKHKTVIGAEYEGKEVKAVITEEGTKHFAKKFISNLHPSQTIDIFGENNFRPAYKNRIQKLENTVSTFTLYLSLKEDSFPYLNYNVYDYFIDHKDIWNITDYKHYDESTWPQAMFSCTPVIKKQSEYAHALSTMAYMSYDEVKEWDDTFNTVAKKGDRGEAYEAFKKRKEQQVIDRLEERFPNIRNCIKSIYSSTPITYKNYIGTSDGSMYGIKKDVRNIIASQLNSKTRIPNVYLTGQSLIFHGILGTSIGALVTCFNFIDQKTLIDKIKNDPIEKV
jgi:all-trans-retinol 13,14-reductase